MTTPVRDAATLPPRCIEIDGIRVGSQLGLPYELGDLNFGGKPDAAVGDIPRPRADGVMFGRDRLAGRIITIEGSINENSYEACAKRWGDLNRVWDAEATRTRSGALTSMRIRPATGAVRRVFGRPRKLDPKEDPGFRLMERGRIDWVAQFNCVDHFYYSDVERNNTIGMVGPITSGLREPLREPLSTKRDGVGLPGDIVVAGDAPSWITATINGPIAQARIDVVGEWHIAINGSLAYDQFVTIITAPWDRSVRLNGNIPVPGALTALSRRLANARLDPGPHQVVLRGLNTENSASLSLSWRDAFLSP